MCLIATYPKLLAEIERWQAIYIREAGFDPATFARQSVNERRFWNLKFLALKASSYFMPREKGRELRDVIGRLQAHDAAHGVSHAALLVALRQGAALYPPPQSRLQRADDHYLLCDLMHHFGKVVPLCPQTIRAPLERALANANVVTAPMGRCNAFVILNQASGQSGIILDDEVGRLSVQIGFLLARLVRNDGRLLHWDADEAVNRLRADAAISEAGASVIRAFAEHGSSRLAPPPPASESEVDVMVLLSQLAIIWTVTHELGHVALGHLCRGSSLAMIEEVELDDIEGDLQRESDADAFADDAMRAVCAAWGHDEGVAAAAGSMILQTYRLLYRAVARIAVPDLSDVTIERRLRGMLHHPTPQERLSASASRYDTALGRGAAEMLTTVFDRLDECVARRPFALHRRWEGLVRSLQAPG
jgi:hypothetical protein